MTKPKTLSVTVELDGVRVVDFDEAVFEATVQVDTPLMDVSIEGPWKTYEPSGTWELTIRAHRMAVR
jgi:hypothetical protein